MSLVLGLEHSCPWPQECLSSIRLSLASDFFVSLASSLVSSTPPLCTKLTIELFAIQLLEAFHKFSTLLLDFDSIAQFFFKQWVI